MVFSSIIIHSLTGVPRSKVKPAALTELSDLFDKTMQSGAAVHAGTQSVVGDIASSNAGAALDAYTGSMADTTNQLDYLTGKAEATRAAHQSAASTVENVQTAADAVCVRAAKELTKLSLLPPLPPVLQARRKIIDWAESSLQKFYAVGAASVASAYSGITPITTITGMGEGEKRGTVPQEVADAYADLTPEERMQFLRNLADQKLEGWPEEDKPEVIFYSYEDPPPPGTQAGPLDEDGDPAWAGANGVRSGDKVYLNYDIGVRDDPITGDPPATTLMSTTIHEIQHVDQGRMRDQYHSMSQADIDAVKAGRVEDPFEEYGSTIDEVERFDIEYEGSDEPGYTHQPVEVDARRGGTEYLDNMSPEEMLELMP